jgi:hypothetical protein
VFSIVHSLVGIISFPPKPKTLSIKEGKKNKKKTNARVPNCLSLQLRHCHALQSNMTANKIRARMLPSPPKEGILAILPAAAVTIGPVGSVGVKPPVPATVVVVRVSVGKTPPSPPPLVSSGPVSVEGDAVASGESSEPPGAVELEAGLGEEVVVPDGLSSEDGASVLVVASGDDVLSEPLDVVSGALVVSVLGESAVSKLVDSVELGGSVGVDVGSVVGVGVTSVLLSLVVDVVSSVDVGVEVGVGVTSDSEGTVEVVVVVVVVIGSGSVLVLGGSPVLEPNVGVSVTCVKGAVVLVDEIGGTATQ